MSRKIIVPELLAPAGSLEKLKVAIDYGANAVYLAGLKFGLRAAADNFTYQELEEGVSYCHNHGAKAYVVLNGFLHDKDLEDLPEFVKYLDEIKVDAVIVSDLGVIETVKANSNLEVHLSTQASCLNAASAKLWKSLGVTRIVVGREVSIAEARLIKEQVDIEIEMFVHGSMCMAYSGNCTISNFTQGRDSNRGGCAHSCRFEYSLDQKQSKVTSHFMSSKDLNGLRLIPEFSQAGIDSIKVEGRMKSHLYAGTVSKVYAEALKKYQTEGELIEEDIKRWESELTKFTHRDYAAANLIEKASRDTIYNDRENDGDYGMLGRVVEAQDDHFVMQVRHAFSPGDQIEVLPFSGENITIKIENIFTLGGEKIEKTKPSTLVKIPTNYKLAPNFIVRGHK